jgi:hypothetical protein
VPDEPSTFRLPAYLEHDVPPTPDLDDPRAYAVWRDECLEVRRVPRDVMAEVLEAVGSDIACLRAAMILGRALNHREWQSRLMVKAFSGRRVVYLMTKCVEAEILSQRGFAIEMQLGVLSAAMTRVMRSVLEEIGAVQDRSVLHLELEVRAHNALVEALSLSEDYDQALHHASEAILLAPHVGLHNIVMGSKYSIADILFRRGDVSGAQFLIEEIIAAPNLQAGLLEVAINFRAITQYWLGDERAMLATLDALEPEARNEHWWLQQFTLHRADLDHDKLKKLGEHNGLAHALTLFSDAVVRAQQLPPERENTIQDIYREATRQLRSLRSVFSKGWFKPYGAILEAFVSRHSKPLDLRASLELLPTDAAVQTMPPAAKVFANAVAIEVMLDQLFCDHSDQPDHIVRLEAALKNLRETFGHLEQPVCEQVAQKLQVLCPTALALASLCTDSPESVIELGNQAIMNLRQRPIAVYGSPGLRPTYAAAITLEALGRGDVLAVARGGGQVREMRTVLCRPYFERSCWFKPIAPAVLLAALLILRDFARSNRIPDAELYQRAASSLASKFGISPRLQQTERIHELDQLEEVLTAGLTAPLDRRRLAALA